VFLAGDFVYKVKKPLRFPFLDYSSLEKRKHFCEEEVRLNSRLAPGIYLGVEAIYCRGNRFHLAPPGMVAEYAVKMRRLKSDRMLDQLVARGCASIPMIHQLARHLARFHFDPANSLVPSGVGTPRQIAQLITANCNEVRSLCKESIEPWVRTGIEVFLESFRRSYQELLWKRVRDGKIRDGHGDLRCEHICFDSEILIYDCIEFDPALRSGDVASEIAFLAMDLDHRKAPELAEELVRQYVEVTDDPELFALVPFYKTYRAAVRGKVEGLKSAEPDVLDREKVEARLAAESLFQLAYDTTWRAISPCMVIFCGLPGAGESTLAMGVAERSGFSWVSSDQIRKEMAGLGPVQKRRVAVGEDIYTEAWSKKTYGRMLELACGLLQQGRGIVLDATFLKSDYRFPFVRLARDLNLPVLLIECRAPRAAIQDRIRKRDLKDECLSDATWDIYVAMERAFEPLVGLSRNEHAVLSTDSSLEGLLEEAESVIKDRIVEERARASFRVGCA
jgi:aminoglycoside phosphotransferase family enzyme/predicted kinase